MVVEAFGYPHKAKKSDSQLIKSIVSLKRLDDLTAEAETKKEEGDDAKPTGTFCNLFKLKLDLPLQCLI